MSGRGRIHSGGLVCLAMFALAGGMLVVFYNVPHGGVPVPANGRWGVPPGRLRFVSCRMGTDRSAQLVLLDQLRKMQPDYLLLQQVEAGDVDRLAKELNLTSPATGPAFYPTPQPDGSSRGTAILSRYPLYAGRSIPNPDGESFGVWAISLIDGQKFVVASVDFSETEASSEAGHFLRDWAALGSGPMVVGGNFSSNTAGGVAALMARPGFGTQVFPSAGRSSVDRPGWIVACGTWRMAGAGDEAEAPGEHGPIRVDLGSNESPPKQ